MLTSQIEDADELDFDVFFVIFDKAKKVFEQVSSATSSRHLRRFALEMEESSRLDEISLHHHRARSEKLLQFCSNTSLKARLENFFVIFIFTLSFEIQCKLNGDQ